MSELIVNLMTIHPSRHTVRWMDKPQTMELTFNKRQTESHAVTGQWSVWRHTCLWRLKDWSPNTSLLKTFVHS